MSDICDLFDKIINYLRTDERKLDYPFYTKRCDRKKKKKIWMG